MSIAVQIYAEGLNHSHGLPQYETKGAAGMDVRANEEKIVAPGQTCLVKTGLFVAIPDGYEIQVRPRSGLSLKTPLRIANAPGTIDSDYRHEVGVIIQNTSPTEKVFIGMGDRIAQLVLKEVPQIEWNPVDSKDELGTTQRTGGFGSTGK